MLLYLGSLLQDILYLSFLIIFPLGSAASVLVPVCCVSVSDESSIYLDYPVPNSVLVNKSLFSLPIDLLILSTLYYLATKNYEKISRWILITFLKECPSDSNLICACAMLCMKIFCLQKNCASWNTCWLSENMSVYMNEEIQWECKKD